jgi:hypothetical protein
MSWIGAIGRWLSGAGEHDPPPIEPLPIEEILHVYKWWPDRNRATQSARKAGFKIVREWDDPIDLGSLTKAGQIAVAAGIGSPEALQGVLRPDFDGFLSRLIGPKRKPSWGGTPEFVFELVVIWSLHDRIDEGLLRRAGWHRSMVRRPLIAAEEEAAAQKAATEPADRTAPARP